MARRKKHPRKYGWRTRKKHARRHHHAMRHVARRLGKRRISRRKRMWISRKIRYLIVHEGKGPKQAAAIAYSMAGVARKKRKHRRR